MKRNISRLSSRLATYRISTILPENGAVTPLNSYANLHLTTCVLRQLCHFAVTPLCSYATAPLHAWRVVTPLCSYATPPLHAWRAGDINNYIAPVMSRWYCAGHVAMTRSKLTRLLSAQRNVFWIPFSRRFRHTVRCSFVFANRNWYWLI